MSMWSWPERHYDVSRGRGTWDFLLNTFQSRIYGLHHGVGQDCRQSAGFLFCEHDTQPTAKKARRRSEPALMPRLTSTRDCVTFPAMFSAKLERRKRFHRLAILAAAALFAAGIVLIAIWAERASSMLTVADADRTPIIIGVLIALAGLIPLCLVVYSVVRTFGRFPSLWTGRATTEGHRL